MSGVAEKALQCPRVGSDPALRNLLQRVLGLEARQPSSEQVSEARYDHGGNTASYP